MSDATVAPSVGEVDLTGGPNGKLSELPADRIPPATTTHLGRAREEGGTYDPREREVSFFSGNGGRQGRDMYQYSFFAVYYRCDTYFGTVSVRRKSTDVLKR